LFRRRDAGFFLGELRDGFIELGMGVAAFEQPDQVMADFGIAHLTSGKLPRCARPTGQSLSHQVI
jgi:hypothetical protein